MSDIAHISLDFGDKAPKPFWQKEQVRAIDDLTKNASFSAQKLNNKPYRIYLKIKQNQLVTSFLNNNDEKIYAITISLSPYKKCISDYFVMINSYEQMRPKGQLEKLETVDMARRALHNEGAELLQSRLSDKVTMDHETARRFFTLICALWDNKHKSSPFR